MTILTENRRRAIAGLLTIILLLAIGFGVGRLMHESSTVRAATDHLSPRTAAVTKTAPAINPPPRTARLQRELASARKTDSRQRRSIASERHAIKRLHIRVNCARGCARDRHPAHMARCLRTTVGA